MKSDTYQASASQPLQRGLKNGEATLNPNDKKRQDKKRQDKKTSSSEAVAVSAPEAIAEAARRSGLALDDDAVKRLIGGCRSHDAAATEHEIAHFVAVKLAQLKNKSSVQNPVGLLIKCVPEYFAAPATELKRLREQYAFAEAEQRKTIADNRELAEQLLADPSTGADDRAWAEQYLADTKGAAA